MLELGDNRIRTIENLEDLTSLKELFLGKNKITKMAGMESLCQLELISLQANRIVKIERSGYFGSSGPVNWQVTVRLCQ